ncbi:rhomboid family intramembrane serine protease [Salibacteraceae bacterium]|nr:rhomboid family intramembrane serine protease [Salibacteraceae bacterium]MDB9709713.1 rhomboid family intramembrane serine protease [Salibacteraceae bacterium]
MQLGGNRWSMMPPVVKNLLIINGLMFLASLTFESSIGLDLNDLLGLHYFQSEKFNIFQIVSYMFMHGSISHIFFNMFAVWMFGSAIENVWGSKRFLIYYLLTGFGAAIIHYITIYIDMAPIISQMEAIIYSPNADAIIGFANTHPWGNYIDSIRYPQVYEETLEFYNNTLQTLNTNPNDSGALRDASVFFQDYLRHYLNLPNVIGASGSLFGILLAFGMMFPNMRLYMIFIPIPIKAKYLMIGYGAMELFSAFQDNPGDNVAHFAHLGGMLFGFIIIKFWEKTGVRWR